MGLFSKKPSRDEDQQQSSIAKPFTLQEGMLARIAELIDAFMHAEGRSDAQMRSTAAAIAATAGFRNPAQPFDDPSIISAPWRMLAAAAHRAAEEGDAFLVGRIFLFSWFWSMLAGKMTRADFFDTLLAGPTEETMVEIATVAQDALPTLPDTPTKPRYLEFRDGDDRCRSRSATGRKSPRGCVDG